MVELLINESLKQHVKGLRSENQFRVSRLQDLKPYYLDSKTLSPSTLNP